MIVIKEMEVPKNCNDCPFLDDTGDYPYCNINGVTHGYNFNTLNRRMPECPICDIKDLTLKEICDIIVS